MAARARVAFVGCGMMSQTVHLPNFSANEKCSIVALAELRKEVGRRVAAKHRIPAVYTSLDEMIASERFDAMAIILPPQLTLDPVGCALKTSKPVFIEKPMATNVADALKMVAASEASHAPIMVAYHKRYDPGVEKAKALIDGYRADGELGKIVSARVWCHQGDWFAGYPRQTIETPNETKVSYPQPGTTGVPEWIAADMRGVYDGVTGNLCHSVNLMRHLIGDPVKVDSAVIRPAKFVWNPPMAILFDYGDFEAVLDTGLVKTEAWDEGVRVNFEKGWLEVRVAPPLLRAPSEVTLRRAGKGVECPVVEYGWAFTREAAHFIDCVAEGGEFRSSGKDSARDLAVIEAMFRSAQERRSVAP